MILEALRRNASDLYGFAELYKKEKNVDAQKDCFEEARKILALHDRLHAL